MVKEDELEFISVQQDDDDNITVAKSSSYRGSDESSIGAGWIFQQSKVFLSFLNK